MGFQDWSLVSCVVPQGRDRIRVTAMLRGRLVRKEGVPILAEVDVMTPGDPPGGLMFSGRTTLVPVVDVEPITVAAREQMEDLGHNVDCMCKTCVGRRKTGRA